MNAQTPPGGSRLVGDPHGSSSEDDSEEESDWDGEVGDDLSWVSSKILDTPSILKERGRTVDSLVRLVGCRGQKWQIQGPQKGEHAATKPRTLKFIMYTPALKEIKIRPPFTPFQRSVLRYLSVAPSQLHLNAWAYIKVFEQLLGVMGRGYGVSLFFTIFELSRTPEQGSDPQRWEQVSLKKRQIAPKLFKPFCDSVHNWRENYAWVVPECSDALESVASWDEHGKIYGFKFPMSWTYSHYQGRPAISYRTSEDLREYDEESLCILENVASWLPGGQIECRRLARAVDSEDFEAILGAVWSAGAWNAPIGEMSKAGFGELLRRANKSKKAAGVIDPPAPSPGIQGGNAGQVNSPLALVASRQGEGSASREKRKRARVIDPNASVDIVTVSAPKVRPTTHSKATSYSLDLDNLQDSDLKRCKENPYLFMAELAKAAEKKAALLKGAQVSATELNAVKRVEELEGQLEATKKTLNDTLAILEPTSKKLSDAEGAMASLKKERNATKSALESEVEKAKKLSQDAEYWKEEYSKEKAAHDATATSAVAYCEERFELAIQQVQLMHPEIVLDRDVIQYHHEVRDGCIFLPEEVEDDGTVAYLETRLWPPA